MWRRLSKSSFLPQGRLPTISYRDNRELLLDVLKIRRGDKKPIVVDKTISYKNKLESIKK